MFCVSDPTAGGKRLREHSALHPLHLQEGNGNRPGSTSVAPSARLLVLVLVLLWVKDGDDAFLP